jgi:hypothetical protein
MKIKERAWVWEIKVLVTRKKENRKRANKSI